MKVSAPHRGWTSGRATPSLRPNPYAAEKGNPAGRHLSFAEICPDDRRQLSTRASRRTYSSASTNTARASGRVSRAAIGAKCWCFYKAYERMDDAIAREKQIKGGSRARPSLDGAAPFL